MIALSMENESFGSPAITQPRTLTGSPRMAEKEKWPLEGMPAWENEEA